MAKINLNNAQFRAFTQFAASVADKGTILKAEDTLTAADGSPRKIVAKGYDHYGHILRKQNSKNINNDIRTLFMNTVLDMFGVKNDKELPKAVRDAMITKDYGKGRPLTARRIIAVSKAIAKVADPVVKSVSMQKAAGLVDDALLFINGKGKNPLVGEAKLDPEQRARAASLVSKYGKGLTDSCLRIFTNYVVIGIACGYYDNEDVEAIAMRMSEELKNVRNFNLGDVRFAKFDAKLTEYWQSLLEDQMGTEFAGDYDDNGLFNGFMKDANRASFTIRGEEFRLMDNKSAQMIDKFKQTIPNIQHRKAISTIFCQNAHSFFFFFSGGRGLQPTSKFPNIDLTSEKGYGMLLAPNLNDQFFENSIFNNSKDITYALEVSDDGTKAKVTIYISGDVAFRLTDSQEIGENATGNYAYETEFEFDLSDKNKARLTGVHTSQALGVPKSQEPQEPQAQLDDIRMPQDDEE